MFILIDFFLVLKVCYFSDYYSIFFFGYLNGNNFSVLVFLPFFCNDYGTHHRCSLCISHFNDDHCNGIKCWSSSRTTTNTLFSSVITFNWMPIFGRNVITVVTIVRFHSGTSSLCMWSTAAIRERGEIGEILVVSTCLWLSTQKWICFKGKSNGRLSQVRNARLEQNIPPSACVLYLEPLFFFFRFVSS